MTVTDIVTVRRQQKADLLRADHGRLVAELSASGVGASTTG
jgi:hypothetical protein